ncbi:vacuolar H+-ATPase assembly protein [Diplocarpon rosae]|nr:vacuolar H+-ATPase assembly protein [Diplocarpon rosae]
MVLLTITASILEALEKTQSLGLEKVKRDTKEKGDGEDEDDGFDDSERTTREHGDKGIQTEHESAEKRAEKKSTEPSLMYPRLGNPISHGQIVELSQEMKARKLQPYRLEDLLKGARVFVPPAPPKPEPTLEYKALMARLRRDEEARSYERMTNPPPPMETFSQRFPAASAARAFLCSHPNINTPDPDDDGIAYVDIHRQVTLILNVLISIFACAAAIWIAAKWWSTPARLALSMSGSALVGVAEVVVYSGYLRRVGEAKGKEKKIKEIKEIVKTWAVGAGISTEELTGESSINIESKEDKTRLRPRERKSTRDVS